MSMAVMTDHVIELLPWYVNGTLKLGDTIRVDDHVLHCAECHKELKAQQRIHQAINKPNTVEIAPQPSFNKLWDRITADQMGEEVVLDSGRARHRELAFSPVARMVEWLRLNWMPISLASQTVAVAVLIGMLTLHKGSNSAAAPDAYRTVTSASVETGAIIHVVFDDATRLGDIKDILLRSNLQVASGPTATGVYSLSPSVKTSEFKASNVIRALRDDPRVRFADLSHD